MTPYEHDWAMMNKAPKKEKLTKQPSKPLVAKLEKSCQKCGATTKLTADHIIPLAVLRSMGMNCTEKINLQALCYSCNQLKGSQLDPKNKKTLPLLEMYIDRWQKFYCVPRRQNVYSFKNLKVNHDTTIYKFGIPDPIEDLKDIYRKQKMRATWRT